MVEERCLYDELVKEWSTMEAGCFVVLSQIKRKGRIETLQTLQARFRDRLKKGSELLRIIFSDSEFRISNILRELEWRGFVEISEGVIRSTRKGRKWRRDRFVLDAFRRWREFQLNKR